MYIVTSLSTLVQFEYKIILQYYKFSLWAIIAQFSTGFPGNLPIKWYLEWTKKEFKRYFVTQTESSKSTWVENVNLSHSSESISVTLYILTHGQEFLTFLIAQTWSCNFIRLWPAWNLDKIPHYTREIVIFQLNYYLPKLIRKCKYSPSFLCVFRMKWLCHHYLESGRNAAAQLAQVSRVPTLLNQLSWSVNPGQLYYQLRSTCF